MVTTRFVIDLPAPAYSYAAGKYAVGGSPGASRWVASQTQGFASKM